MSDIETMLIILIAINSAALIFLLFERDRLLKRIDQHDKWLISLGEEARHSSRRINIIGDKVFLRR